MRVKYKINGKTHELNSTLHNAANLLNKLMLVNDIRIVEVSV